MGRGQWEPESKQWDEEPGLGHLIHCPGGGEPGHDPEDPDAESCLVGPAPVRLPEGADTRMSQPIEDLNSLPSEGSAGCKIQGHMPSTHGLIYASE